MERALDAGAVVAAELPDVRDHVRDVLGGDLVLAQGLLAPGEARLGETPEVHDDLEKPVEAIERSHPRRDVSGESTEERLELVARLLHAHITDPHAGNTAFR